MNAVTLQQLFPYLPVNNWHLVPWTCKHWNHIVQNSNLIQQLFFSARFHLKVTIPPQAMPSTIYTFHKRFAENPAARTWALKTGTPVQFSSGHLDQCILMPGGSGPRVVGISGTTLEIRTAQACDFVLSPPCKHKIALLAASRDGKTIAAGSFQNELFIHSLANQKWQALSSRKLNKLAEQYGKMSLESLSFFPDGRIFTAYHAQTTGIAFVWDLVKSSSSHFLIKNFRLDGAHLGSSSRSFVAQGIAIVDESPRSFECDQPPSTPKAKPLRVLFHHYEFATRKITTIFPPGYPHASVKPNQFAVVSDNAFVAAVDDPNSKARLIWMSIDKETGKKLEDLTDGYEITNLCLGTNGLLHATTRQTAHNPDHPQNQLRTYDLTHYTRISCVRLDDLPDHSSRTLFLSSIPGALALTTAQNGHTNLITFRPAAPTTAATEVIDLVNDSLDLHLSPSLQSQPSVPLASPKALPLNSPPEPPRKRKSPSVGLSTAASSASSSSSASSVSTAPPAKHHKK